MPPRKPKGPTPVEAIKHREQRANIPTEELREFVRPAEEKPSTLLYPRDPSLDPQLVWKGKDEQDAEDLAVPAVPIYIQEKVHPQALIENLRDTAKAGEPEPEQLLFADFDGVGQDFDRKIDFYSHDLGSQPRWSNRMILGDSLLVMASLAEKEGLKGKVQTIYMDPPYGIKFGSNWQVSTRKRDVKDGKVEYLAREPEVVKAFRDTWELGIHSYLAYLRDRLVVARELLTETGSIFVQIGDENVHLVRSVMDEVLGSENFVRLITFRTRSPLGTTGLAKAADYVLWYGRDAARAKLRDLFSPKSTWDDEYFDSIEDAGGIRRRMTGPERAGLQTVPEEARIFSAQGMLSSGRTESCVFEYAYRGRHFFPGGNRSWRTTLAGMDRLAKANRLIDLASHCAWFNISMTFP